VHLQVSFRGSAAQKVVKLRPKGPRSNRGRETHDCKEFLGQSWCMNLERYTTMRIVCLEAAPIFATVLSSICRSAGAKSRRWLPAASGQGRDRSRLVAKVEIDLPRLRRIDLLAGRTQVVWLRASWVRKRRWRVSVPRGNQAVLHLPGLGRHVQA
jgi:hypothetical protein